MQPNKRLMIPIVALALALVSAAVAGQTLVYREQTGERSETHRYTVSATEGGFLIKLERDTAAGPIVDDVLTDGAWNTLHWVYRNPATRSDLTGNREGHAITVQGAHEGKRIDTVFKIDEHPWKQLFSIDFETFAALRPDEKGHFWSIGTAGAGNMKCARFVVKPKGLETVPLNGRQESALHLRISLGGLQSLFWHGDYWFRAGDHRYLLFRGRSLFGSLSTKALCDE
jgi:hypothetical protein